MDEPFVIFGTVSGRLCDSIRGKACTEEFLQKAFAFFNEMAESDDLQVQNLLCVGVLEGFTDYPECMAVARKYLSEKGQYYLDEIWKFWHERVGDDQKENLR